MTKIYGHRGAKGMYPENTLLSFSKAIEQGVEGLELDVHLTKDGEVVVIHDETLDRTTSGTGWIKDVTLAEIKQYSAGSPFSHLPKYVEEWNNEQVPTLKEVLQLLEPYPIELNIELKTYAIAYQGIEEEIKQLVDEYGKSRKVVYSSFHLPSLLRIKQIDPKSEIAWLLNHDISLPHDYIEALHLESLHINKSILLSKTEYPEHIQQLFDNLRVWTVNEPGEIKRLLDLQVNSIITDFPERAIALRNERNQEVNS
ncbi:glycerophosphodiester phosphodiesterase [Ferdinandcohnia sp. Marseille-Q9671]